MSVPVPLELRSSIERPITRGTKPVLGVEDICEADLIAAFQRQLLGNEGQLSLTMAESDLHVASDLVEAFSHAASHLENLVPVLDSRQLLSFYGLYKQATVGPCDVPRPSWFQIQAKQKWDAWSALGDMSRESAMEKYVHTLTEVDPEWKNQATSTSSTPWVAVSCMYNDEEELRDADKTLLDWVKDGNEDAVWRVLSRDKSEVSLADEDGMLPIHWAADRGHLAVVRLLIEAGTDKDSTDDDGQTPLHYAASCGHTEVVKYLLSIGAKIMEDNDGLTPKDVAGEDLAILF